MENQEGTFAVAEAWHDLDHRPIREEVGCFGSFDAVAVEAVRHAPILVPNLEGVVDAVGFGLVAEDCLLVFHVEADHAGKQLGHHRIRGVVEGELVEM